MNLILIQSNTVWENKPLNFTKIEQLIKKAVLIPEIIILPEMFNTGFSMNPEKLSEPADGETFVWMRDLAKRCNSAICGSYTVKENNNYYNRFTFVSPGKERWHYDKRHLFSIGDEEKEFTKGNRRVVFRYGDLRICPNICYDLRFPVWTRNLNDYDLLINSASWPEARQDVWLTLLRARAIENQCFVAGSNRTGTDGNGVKHCGDSMVIDPRGNIISSGKADESVIEAEIFLKDLREFRKKFPVSDDADKFVISE